MTVRYHVFVGLGGDLCVVTIDHNGHIEQCERSPDHWLHLGREIKGIADELRAERSNPPGGNDV